MTHQVRWDVGGQPIWFRCDGPLRPAAAAIASALYVSACAAGADLGVADPVDRTWLRNSGALGRTAHRWFGYRAARVAATAVDDRRAGPSGGRALCFSLGVDSFDTLLRARRPPDLLVTAGGYDTPIGNRARIDAVAERVGDVAAVFGVEHRDVRTNLRDHPAADHGIWDHTHGGALAALGHLLDVDELLVSASSAPGHDRPWGTHWDLDPLYSSGRTRLVHVGHDSLRFDKIGRIARSSIALDHLQVCWQLRPELENCAECSKCVITMACLDAFGALERATTFRPAAPLPDLVDALPFGAFPNMTRQIIDTHPDATVRAALAGFLARVPHRDPMPAPEPRWTRWAKQRRDGLRIRAGTTPQKSPPTDHSIDVGPASHERG